MIIMTVMMMMMMMMMTTMMMMMMMMIVMIACAYVRVITVNLFMLEGKLHNGMIIRFNDVNQIFTWPTTGQKDPSHSCR